MTKMLVISVTFPVLEITFVKLLGVFQDFHDHANPEGK